MRMTALIAAAAALLGVTATAGALPVVSPVTSLKVTPLPFHSGEPVMRVTFRTSTPAPVGRRYYAFWQSLDAEGGSPQGCSPSSSVRPFGATGGRRRLVRMWLHPEPTFGTTFCTGPSRLVVFSQLAAPNGMVRPNATGKTYRALARLSFDVLP